MNPTPLRRSLAAVATAVACLALMAHPAAATTHDISITGGEITLTKPGYSEAFDIGPGTPSCSSSMTADENGTTVAVTALSAAHVHHFFGSAGAYLVVFTRSPVGSSPGTIDSTSTPHTITSLQVGILVRIYDTTTCTPTGTPLCSLGLILRLDGTSTSLTVSSAFSLTGGSVGTVAAFPTCTAGPTLYIGTTATVTSAITGHLST